MKSQTMCVLPWNHLYAAPDGYVRPCCVSNPDPYHRGEENLSEVDVPTALNSPSMKLVRKQMVMGLKPKTCSNCYESERVHGHSDRLDKNESYELENKLDYLSSITNIDGSINKFEIQYIDIRFSNLCNFRCRMCSHRFSSSWYEEAIELHDDIEWFLSDNLDEKVVQIDKYGDLWDKLEPYLGGLEYIYFAGGEPLVTEYHYKILEKLIEIKNFPQLHYNTNLSKLKYKQYDLLEMWKYFPSIMLSVSLDGSKEQGEYIRKGMKWDIILKSREIIREKCPRVNISVHCVLQVTNSLHFIKFFTELLRTNFVDNPTEVSIDCLSWPNFQSVTILPENVKDRVKRRVGVFKKWIINEYPHTNDHLLNELDNFVDYMYSKDHTDYLPIYFDNMKKLDKIRNENLLNVFPELKVLAGEIK